MDWITLLQPWALVALIFVSLIVVVAVVILLLRGKFRVKEIKVPLLFATLKAERVEEENEGSPGSKPSSPRQARTIQKAKATGGAKAEVEQAAPKGAPATQEGTADGEGTELKLKQNIQ